MTIRPLTVCLAAAALAACGKTVEEVRYEPGPRDVIQVAREACDDSVDDEMRLRGYPRRPSADTPQASFRRIIFDKCMSSLGYVPE